MQHNNKDVDTATKGMEVCIKIEPVPGEAPKMFGRHFTEEDLLISKVGDNDEKSLALELNKCSPFYQISRESIDACKDYFRDELQKSDWQLMVELKKLFEIL